MLNVVQYPPGRRERMASCAGRLCDKEKKQKRPKHICESGGGKPSAQSWRGKTKKEDGILNHFFLLLSQLLQRPEGMCLAKPAPDVQVCIGLRVGK